MGPSRGGRAWAFASTRSAVRGDARAAQLGRARALQHRPRRVRQARARPAGDGLGGLAGQRAAGELRRAAGPLEPLRQRARGERRRARRPRRHAAAVAARDRRRLPRHLQARRDPAVDVGALRRRRHPAPPAATRGAKARRHRRRQPRPHPRRDGRDRVRDGRRRRRGRRRLRRRDGGRRRDYEMADTAADDPAQLYYSSGTTGKAKGILHAHRYLLAHEEFEFCHDVRDGELFHGSGEWAWAAGIAPLLGPVALRRGRARAGAQGRLRPRGAPALPVEARRREHVHHADRAARDDRRRGRRQALPARAAAHLLLGRRAAQPRGDPLVPRPVRRSPCSTTTG